MEVSDSLTRRDQCLQIVQKDTRPLSLMDKLKGGCDKIETLEESKILLGKISQNSDYIKRDISYLFNKLESTNIAEHSKETVLSSSGILEVTRSLNSDKWKYLIASLEDTSVSK